VEPPGTVDVYAIPAFEFGKTSGLKPGEFTNSCKKPKDGERKEGVAAVRASQFEKLRHNRGSGVNLKGQGGKKSTYTEFNSHRSALDHENAIDFFSDGSVWRFFCAG